jgi:hypothetical protein
MLDPTVESDTGSDRFGDSQKLGKLVSFSPALATPPKSCRCIIRQWIDQREVAGDRSRRIPDELPCTGCFSDFE